MVTVVIPAHNEAQTLTALLPRIRHKTIVVDDGSIDNTAEVARENGAEVISFTKNKGYVSALDAGLRASEDDCITFDADGEHDPLDIPAFLEGDADIIVGKRPHLPRKGERILSCCCRELYGFEDPLCGFRFIRKEILKNIPFSGNDFGLGFILSAFKRGYSVDNVSIRRMDRRDEARVGGTKEIDRRLLAITMEVLKDELQG